MVESIRRGLAAGFAGAMAMSVSTNAEMRLRGRPPSDAPARVLSRLLRIDASTRRRKALLASGGHLATSLALGAARGAMAAAGMRPAPAGATLLGLALLPEILIVPALGASPPPWRWSANDSAISVLHHGVYAGVTNATYGMLERRG